MTFIVRTAVLAVLFAPVATPIALAQQASAPAAPAASATWAASVAAEGARLAYRSAFDGYRGFTDQPVESWRKANDDVGRIGGWKAYAREGQGGGGAGGHEPAMPAGHGGMRMGPASPTPAAPAKAPAGHSGHRMP